MNSMLPTSADKASRELLVDLLAGSSDRTSRKLAWAGGSVAAILFSIAAFVPIDSGALAPGIEMVENKRKTVQHLDGGMIRQIHVREGSVARAGQLLITLDDTNARLNVSVYQAQSDALRAEQAALTAQLLGKPEIEFPADLLKRADDPVVGSIIRSQRAAFAARRDNVSGRKAQLAEQVGQLREEISGSAAGSTARTEQLKLLDEEIVDLEKLFEKGYATKQRLLALKRAAAGLRGERAELSADAARLRTRQSEVRILSLQTERESAADAANALRAIQSQLAEVQDKLAAARQVLARTQIRAPVTGTVVGMRPTTIGGVIQAGEPLMDVVPNDERLVVVARVSPRDADKLHVGQSARVRFDASGARNAPVVEGTLQKFSADALTDKQSGTMYFEAEVSVAEEQKRTLPPELLRPGVPASVLIRTGQRTMLAYLFAPIWRASFNGLREQ
jgi:epimerase transport system membrane fusion protein